MAFGADLLDAMLGGIIEYAALVTGYRMLAVAGGIPIWDGFLTVTGQTST